MAVIRYEPRQYQDGSPQYTGIEDETERNQLKSSCNYERQQYDAHGDCGDTVTNWQGRENSIYPVSIIKIH